MRSAIPASRRHFVQAKPQPQVQSGAAGCPPCQGTHLTMMTISGSRVCQLISNQKYFDYYLILRLLKYDIKLLIFWNNFFYFALYSFDLLTALLNGSHGWDARDVFSQKKEVQMAFFFQIVVSVTSLRNYLEPLWACYVPQIIPQERISSELLRWTWILQHGVTWWWASYLATARSRHSARPSLPPLTSSPTTLHVPLWRSIKPRPHCQGWS